MATIDSVNGVADWIAALPTEGIGISPSVYIWIRLFVFFIFAVFGVLIYWKFYLQYRIPVLLQQKTGSGVEFKRDKAKIVVDGHGKKKLSLFKTRKGKDPVTCPIPANTNRYKMGKLDFYMLFMDDNYSLHPIISEEINDEVGLWRIRPRPEERQSWLRLELRSIEDKYKEVSKWKEFLPHAIFIGTLVICFLILFFMFKEIGNGFQQLASALNRLA